MSHVSNANSKIHWTISVKISPVFLSGKSTFNRVSKSNLKQAKKYILFCIYHTNIVTKDQNKHYKIFRINYVKFLEKLLLLDCYGDRIWKCDLTIWASPSKLCVLVSVPLVELAGHCDFLGAAPAAPVCQSPFWRRPKIGPSASHPTSSPVTQPPTFLNTCTGSHTSVHCTQLNYTL